MSEEKTTLAGVELGSPIVRKALVFSIWDGTLCNGMVALNETFGIAGALSLRATSMGIAVMTSLPMLLGSLAQFLIPAWANPAHGRKRYVLASVTGQWLCLLLAACAGWLSEPWRAPGYIAMFILAAVCGSIAGPFWLGWMGDLIPGEARGRLFAWRSIFFSWMYLLCSLTAGSIVRSYDSANAPWLLFAIVFACAGLLRLGSWVLLRLQFEPPSVRAAQAFNPLRFRPGRDFAVYGLATASFQGAASLSSSFFNVWFLRDLHFNYLQFSVTLCMMVVGSIAFARFWGRLADNFGTARVLWVSGLLITFIPFPYLWLHNHWAIWMLAFYSGAAWSGYNLANFNQLLNATEGRQREHYIALAFSLQGLMGAVLSLLGGFLATRLPIIFGWQLQSLFLLSGVLRVLIFFGLFRKFKEYREALPRRHTDVYAELPGYRIGIGLMRNVFGGFRDD